MIYRYSTDNFFLQRCSNSNHTLSSHDCELMPVSKLLMTLTLFFLYGSCIILNVCALPSFFSVGRGRPEPDCTLKPGHIHPYSTLLWQQPLTLNILPRLELLLKGFDSTFPFTGTHKLIVSGWQKWNDHSPDYLVTSPPRSFPNAYDYQAVFYIYIMSTSFSPKGVPGTTGPARAQQWC